MNTVMDFREPYAIITVGIDAWENNTAGLVASWKQCQPDSGLVVVDNCAKPAYPKLGFVTRLNERTSYAAALNYGMAQVRVDWYITMNNDVLLSAPFAPYLEGLPPGVYGNVMMPAFTHNMGREWLDGWVMIVHRAVYEAIGGFDENFLMAGFEDADYCWRALEAGYLCRALPFPFYHKDAHTRYSMTNYFAQRATNIEYLRAKWRL